MTTTLFTKTRARSSASVRGESSGLGSRSTLSLIALIRWKRKFSLRCWKNRSRNVNIGGEKALNSRARGEFAEARREKQRAGRPLPHNQSRSRQHGGVESVSQPRSNARFEPSRDVAQPGRALAWGARGRQIKSARPDQKSSHQPSAISRQPSANPPVVGDKSSCGS